MTTVHSTREAYLLAAVDAVTPLFTALDLQVPPVRISVGFPKRSKGSRGTVIGQCHPGELAADGVGQIFVSPILGDVLDVLETITHELVHAINHAAGETGHGRPFSKIALKLGFETPMTETPASVELKHKLRAIANDLGDYPHAALTSAAPTASVQKNRQLLVTCAAQPDIPVKERYKVRMTRQWMDAVGLPTCPCHNAEMELSA